jgi:UDP-N-acetylmuramoyl-tripeptide--D-alanyl-D-alanine ligase
MRFALPEIARVIGAAGVPPPLMAEGWSVDSRTVAAGDLYFALRGPRHDGHDYAAAAARQGAVAAVVERPSGAPCELLAADSQAALETLAAWARRRWAGPAVGVTGSAGKTTTKDAIAHLLAADRPVGKSIGNLNNHVGVPLSILRLRAECRAAVLELAMNHAGEIGKLAAILRPDIGVVTNVGHAHVGFLGSLDSVAAAKGELIEALPRDGVAVLNADDARVFRFRERHAGRSVTFGFSERAEVRAEGFEPSGAGSRFRALGVEFESQAAGRHEVMNLLAALAVARVFEIAPERLREAVRTFAPGPMRGRRTERDGIVVWDDCYNSNPEAAEAMLDALAERPAARRIAVLGEMLELGEASETLHRRLGGYAVARGVDVLVGVRGMAQAMVGAAIGAGLPPAAGRFFDDPAEAGAYARSQARPGDAVLFKGSRGVGMERALERFLE